MWSENGMDGMLSLLKMQIQTNIDIHSTTLNDET